MTKNRWAILSFVFAVIGAVSFSIVEFLVPAFAVFLLCVPLSLISGAVALRQINQRKGEEKGGVLAWIGIVFGGVIIVVSIVFLVWRLIPYLMWIYTPPIHVGARQVDPTQYFSMQLKKACGGDKLAQFVVAKSYDSGEGIELDKVEAYKWYTLAASEWPEAIKFKDRLRQQMTLSEIAEAERRVAEWRPGNCEAEQEAGTSPTN